MRNIYFKEAITAGRPGGSHPGRPGGSPRIVLIREFESRRGEILNLFAKKKRKKGSTAESA